MSDRDFMCPVCKSAPLITDYCPNCSRIESPRAALIGEVEQLSAELAEAKRDAARYRWLRDNSASISWNPSRFNAEIVSGFSHAGTGYLGFNFEDAINAAMGGVLND